MSFRTDYYILHRSLAVTSHSDCSRHLLLMWKKADSRPTPSYNGIKKFATTWINLRRTAAADQSQSPPHQANRPYCTDASASPDWSFHGGSSWNGHSTSTRDVPTNISVLFNPHQQWRLEGQLWQLDKVLNNISSSRTSSKPLPSTWDVPASNPKLMGCFLTCDKCRESDHTLDVLFGLTRYIEGRQIQQDSVRRR